MTNATASPSVCRCRLHTCHAAGARRRPRPWEAQPRGPASLPQTVALSSGSTPELLVQPHVTRPLSAAGTPAGKGGPTVACSFCPPAHPSASKPRRVPLLLWKGGHGRDSRRPPVWPTLHWAGPEFLPSMQRAMASSPSCLPRVYTRLDLQSRPDGGGVNTEIVILRVCACGCHFTQNYNELRD